MPRGRGRAAGHPTVVVYDDRCPLCCSLMERLQGWDEEGCLVGVGLDPERLSQIHPALDSQACRREIHIITPEGEVLRGWDGVTYLARLFPKTRWVGVWGSLAPFRWLGRRLYSLIAHHRHRL